MPEPNRSGSFFLRKDETMRTLLEIFQDTKETLCRYDYYIHTQKRIFHLTNSEIKIPHLMGMQYHQIIYREVFLCLRRQKSEVFWNFWEKI